jgi:hypothetical protein
MRVLLWRQDLGKMRKNQGWEEGRVKEKNRK